MLECPFRLTKRVPGFQHGAEIIVCLSEGRLHRHRAAPTGFGLGQIAQIEGRGCGQIQQIGVLGLLKRSFRRRKGGRKLTGAILLRGDRISLH